MTRMIQCWNCKKMKSIMAFAPGELKPRQTRPSGRRWCRDCRHISATSEEAKARHRLSYYRNRDKNLEYKRAYVSANRGLITERRHKHERELMLLRAKENGLMCRRCDQYKLMDAFTQAQRIKISPWCRDCHREYYRVRYNASPQLRERKRQYRIKNQKRINKYRRERYAESPDKLREYWRQWKIANKEKVRQQARERRLFNLENYREREKKRYLKNREKINAQAKKRRCANPEKFREKNRSYAKKVRTNPEKLARRRELDKKWKAARRAADPVKFRLQSRVYREINRERINASARKCHAKPEYRERQRQTQQELRLALEIVKKATSPSSNKIKPLSPRQKQRIAEWRRVNDERLKRNAKTRYQAKRETYRRAGQQRYRAKKLARDVIRHMGVEL